MNDIILSNKEVKRMTNSKKPSEPVEEERWAMEEVLENMTQNELTQVLLCVSLVLGIVTAYQRWKNHW